MQLCWRRRSRGGRAWRAWRGIELSAGARNLLDARDDATLGLPPRTIYVGLRGEARHTPTERTP